LLRNIALTGLLALGSGISEAPARADAILNGMFTSTTGTFGAAGGGLNTQGDYTSGGSLSNWTIADVNGSSGLAFLYLEGDQGSSSTAGEGIALSGRFGNFSVYDPGNVAGSTPSGGAIPNTSPGGGNFISADGASGYNVAIEQTISDLTAGVAYAVSFYYAAGQQYNYSSNTTEGWQVSLENSAQTTQTTGANIQDTPSQAHISGTNTPGLANGGFQSWAQDTMTFTATSSTQVLTFLSLGTPSGQPPIDFLSDVSLNISPAPEPFSGAMSGIGVASMIALFWFRKKRAREGTAS